MANKGSPFEREICKVLSLWWTGGESDDVFWRTSQSGGRATTRRKKGKTTRAHCGDICALDEEGAPLMKVVTLELKRGYNKHTVHDLLDRPDHAAFQMFENWIFQASTAADNAGTPHWIIIHRRDKKQACVFFPNSLYVGLESVGSSPSPFPSIRIKWTSKKGGKHGTVVGMLLKHFLSMYDPDDFRVLFHRLRRKHAS